MKLHRNMSLSNAAVMSPRAPVDLLLLDPSPAAAQKLHSSTDPLPGTRSTSDKGLVLELLVSGIWLRSHFNPWSVKKKSGKSTKY